MTDVFKNLPPMSWRGIKVPLLDRSVSFGQGEVIHAFNYRPDHIVEKIGADNLVFNYTIPFREDIAKGPYANLFTQVLPKFFEACRDNSEGELIDPVFGPWQCTPRNFSDTSSPLKRDGDDIQVQFVYSPEPGDEEQDIPSLESAASDAGALNAAAEAVALGKYKQLAPPEPLHNPLSVATGLIKQVQSAGQKIDALVHDTSSRLEAFEDAVEDITDPELWPLRASSRRLRRSLQRLALRQDDSARPLRSVVLDRDMTVSALASRYGLSTGELLQLNPGIAKTPLVPAGTTVRYYRDN